MTEWHVSVSGAELGFPGSVIGDRTQWDDTYVLINSW